MNFTSWIESGIIMLCGTASLLGQQCELVVSTSSPILKSEQKQTCYVKVGLNGFEKKSDKERTPLNIALVLDRSGSMSGEKINQAKKAAISAVEQLSSDDIISIVVYSDQVEVIVPATKLTDRDSVLQKIQKIEASGTTALHAGTSAGAKEVEKFLDQQHVNRVVLLSDGLANVGPSSVSELQELGKTIAGKGISVSTFGLGEGFNEELMLQLAQASDGNHIFITAAQNMTDVFVQEFQFAAETVAKEISGKFVAEEGIRPVRALNMDVDISGQNVTFQWNQIFSKQERYVILEVEVPATPKDQERKLGTAHFSYANMSTNVTDELSGSVAVRFSDSASAVEESVDKKVMESVIFQLANLENQRATQLRDAGDIQGAQMVLQENTAFLNKAAADYDSEKLGRAAELNSVQRDEMSDSSLWNSSRKKMRAFQGAASNAAPEAMAPVK